ncbi:MAG: hypothetical protein RBS72_22175 [Sedimentisphaerales bacterium]|jgi:hypothetical protein|nr:hypothetical protein [Sedimentisphaerales bacterium]
MNQISAKKVLWAFIALLLLSRTGRIVQFFETLDLGGILTLEPLRNSPEGGRFLVTVALLALAFVTIHSFFRK